MALPSDQSGVLHEVYKPGYEPQEDPVKKANGSFWRENQRRHQVGWEQSLGGGLLSSRKEVALGSLVLAFVIPLRTWNNLG